MNPQNLSSSIWSVADLLRGDYKQSEHGRVILPFTVLQRLDCVLEPTKGAELAEKEKREAVSVADEHLAGLNGDARLADLRKRPTMARSQSALMDAAKPTSPRKAK